MKSKILFFIATEKGYSVLKTIIKFNKDVIGAVVTFNEINVKENYYYKIVDKCKNNDIASYDWKEAKEKLSVIVNENNVNAAMTIGWRFLIPLSINRLLKYRLMVFHDSLLPKYRGFTPTPTAIICGESKIGMSVIYAENQIDAGDIIIQKSFYVYKDQYIKSIIEKQSKLYCEAAVELIEMMENDKLIVRKQDNSEATYSIWRNPEDCEINWNDEAVNIYNLIRGVSLPYTGAYTYMLGKRIYVWKAEEEDNLKFVIRQPGKIWNIYNGNPIVICGKGMLKLLDVRDEKENKINFNKIRIRLGRG